MFYFLMSTKKMSYKLYQPTLIVDENRKKHYDEDDDKKRHIWSFTLYIEYNDLDGNNILAKD